MKNKAIAIEMVLKDFIETGLTEYKSVVEWLNFCNYSAALQVSERDCARPFRSLARLPEAPRRR